jgi:hypothetical protein
MVSQWPMAEETPVWCTDSVQTAALFGLGLLHMGTGDRLVTELMLDEIGQVSRLDKVRRFNFNLSWALAVLWG